MKIKSVILKILIATLISIGFYFLMDYIAVKNWDNKDSIIVKLLEAAPEHVKNYDDANSNNDKYRILEREIVILPLSNSNSGVQKINVTRLENTGLNLIIGQKYLLVWDVFDDGSVQYSIADAFRVPAVGAFILGVFLTLILLTGKSGLYAVLGLLASIGILIFVMLPLIVKGWSPINLAISSVFIISTVTILCVVRHSKYRLVALLGSLGGVLCGFLIAYIVVHAWQLNGLGGEGSALLASTLPALNMRGILLSSILVGAIGAVLDVGVSITASMSEFLDYDPHIHLDRLLLAGLNVGNEVLGSMINTLILAYIGSSLPMALLISSAGVNISGFLNDPYIAQEIIQSLAGTLGLLFTIPVTAFFFVIQEGFRRRDE